jgi:TonB family protein
MLRYILIILTLFALQLGVSSSLSAQNDKSTSVTVYTAVEVMPVYPGGEQALMEFISNNLKVPQAAIEAGINGKMLVGFTVDTTGKVGNVKVEKGLGFGLDEEAARVVSNLPTFTPGRNSGKVVNVRMVWPIKITLKVAPAPAPPPLPKPGDYKINNGDTIYTSVEQMPVYPGGDAALMEHIRNNLVIPDAAKQAGVNGKLFVGFTVTETGNVMDIRIEKGLGYGLNEEAMRVVSTLKRFEPGRQDGKPVKIRYVWPIKITLSNPAPVRRRLR